MTREPANQQSRRWPETDDRKWYVQRGIPIIPLLAIALGLAGQSAIGIRYITGLETKIETVTASTARVESRVDRLDTRVENLAAKMDTSLVPAAVNGRRIEELERQAIDLTRRLSELERAGSRRWSEQR
jgi:hypothetical protein